jgi:hypothetical protein
MKKELCSFKFIKSTAVEGCHCALRAGAYNEIEKCAALFYP